MRISFHRFLSHLIFCICLNTTGLFAGFNFSHESSTVRLGNGGSAVSFYLSNNVSGWNGTLHKGANGSIVNTTAKTIGFSDGVFDNNGVRSRLTSTYEPSGTYELTLGNNQYMYAEPGEVAQSVKIDGTNVKIEGQPRFSSAVVFGATATAYFGLQSRLNQNIQFDSGGGNTLYLSDDLHLADDVTVVNNGIIDVKGFGFWFGGKSLTLNNTIEWRNAGDINLSSRIFFDGTWNITDETTVNGHGNVIDVSGGGVFSLAASTTLHLTDVVIKGINNSTFAFGDIGSTVRLSNATFHFPENVTHTTGLFYVDGPATVFMPDTDWAFNGDSNLTVSAVTLWMDEGDKSGVDSIIGNVSMIYSGTVKEIYSTGDMDTMTELANNNSSAIILHENRIDTAEIDITTLEDLVKFIHGPRDFTLSSNTTLTVDTWLSNDRVCTVGANITFDGDKHAINFASNDNNVLNVGANDLTLQNVTLQNFAPSSMSVTTGSITFGTGTIIEMHDNQTLTSSNYTMSCSGAVTLNCHGNELDISGREHGIDILSGGTLTISNARIKGLGGTNGNSYTNNIRCLATDATLTLKNCELVLEDNYTFAQGALNIYQDVVFRAPEMPSGTPLVFAYQSGQAATIRSLGYLKLDRYLTFSYDSSAASKEKIVMEDATSILHLNGCTLYSTHTGLQLTGGRLIIEDKVTVQNEATVQEEAIVLKDPLDIDVLSGGVIDLTEGLLEYQ